MCFLATRLGLANTATGINALGSNIGGDFNTASGLGALFGNTMGSYNRLQD